MSPENQESGEEVSSSTASPSERSPQLNVTARAAAERDAVAALRRRDQALAVVAHELGSPITVFVGVTQTLRQHWAEMDDARKLDLLARAEAQAGRMQRLVDHVLSAAAIDAGTRPATPEAVDVAGVVAACVGRLGPRAAEVSVECPPDLVAYADRDHLVEILENYLENAFKYGEPPVRVGAARVEGSVELRVSDGGQGVPAAFVPRLFERFSRDSATSGLRGTGLGLAIVADLASGNGGKAWYEPGEHGGATFCVRMPVGPPVPETGREFVESLVAITGVLLNEDTLAALLQPVVMLSCSAMAEVDGSSVSLLRGKIFETNNTSSSEVRDLDRVQYQTGKGPCVAAIEGGQRINVALAEEDPRWPEFATAARAQGFVGVLSTPLVVRERHLGALNLYSRTQAGFGTASEETAQLFADQASAVLSNALAFAAAEMVNTQLQEALASRDVIGQAKGILMARHGCTSDEAFELLCRASQHANQKLRDVAQELVESI